MTTVTYSTKHRMMAGDKMACEGNNKTGRMTKIFRIGGCLVGFSGSADVCMALRHWFESGGDPESYPETQSDEMQASMLVVTPDNKVMFYERFPTPIIMENEYFAIGSGRDFALAILHLGQDPAMAVRVASELDCFTGSGVDVLHLEEPVAMLS